MKLKRAKAYKKLMGYLQLNFGFREPFQVLLDEEILLEAASTKYDLAAGLERTLQGKVKPMITQCVMEHLYRAKSPEAKEAIRIAKTFERRRCGHIPPEKETVSAFECISECVGPTNKNRYCVATQKPKLRAKFRNIPAVPLIYIHRAVMILEPMSKTTQRIRNDIEESKLTKGLNEVHKLETEETGNVIAGKKRVRGPNPLSVKKKKTTNTEEKHESVEPKKRRKRGKKKADDAAETNDKSEPVEDIGTTELE